MFVNKRRRYYSKNLKLTFLNNFIAVNIKMKSICHWATSTPPKISSQSVFDFLSRNTQTHWTLRKQAWL